MGRLPPRALGALLAALGGGSCSLFLPTMEVPLALPELPAHWPSTFPELELHLESSEGSAGVTGCGAGSEIALRLPKRAYLPVVARPCLPQAGLVLPCAGGVYPLDADPEGTLALSWRGGPAAELLLRLEARGLDLEGLNVPRLCVEMQLRGGEDPWNLDLAAIAAGLASGQMRVTDIRLQPLSDLRLPAGPGEWFLESPLRLPCAADAEGLVSLQGVSPGLHRLFRAGGGSRVDLYVSGSEVLWVRNPAAAR